MKVLLISLALLSCTKQLVVAPEQNLDKENEKIKFEKINYMGEKKESKIKYNVMIVDHEKNSKIEYAIPKDQKWQLPIDIFPIVCKTNGEEIGNEDFFFMELSCKGATQYELASVVACGVHDKFDAETIRILKDGDPYLTLQLRCLK